MSDIPAGNPESPVSPFVPTTTPTIDRANRLISVRSNPGFLDIIRISQDLVKEAEEQSTDFRGWDPQQIVMLKCRSQAAKEHHVLLLSKINEAVEQGVAEARDLMAKFAVKTAAEAAEQGDYVRQKMLETFDQMDNRIAGSYTPEG
jgi:hypothetical protein